MKTKRAVSHTGTDVASKQASKQASNLADDSSLYATRFARFVSLVCIAIVPLLAACGASAPSPDVIVGDVVRPRNAAWCGLIVADATVTIQPSAGFESAILCGPDMPAGATCRAQYGVFGTCRDFVEDSSGYFAEYAQHNRVPRYCLPIGHDPCGPFSRMEAHSECAFGIDCVRIPNPLPGRRAYVCPPEPCN